MPFRRRPLGPPSPQPVTLFQSPPASNGNDGAFPLAYDRNWQYFTNLTPEQVAWFQAQPEWQNFVAWVALDPPNATMHANAPADTAIQAALTAANVPVAINAGPLPSPPVTTRASRL